jgi:hypothetical protein
VKILDALATTDRRGRHCTASHHRGNGTQPLILVYLEVGAARAAQPLYELDSKCHTNTAPNQSFIDVARLIQRHPMHFQYQTIREAVVCSRLTNSSLDINLLHYALD